VLPCTNTKAKYGNSVVTVMPPDSSVQLYHCWGAIKKLDVHLVGTAGRRRVAKTTISSQSLAGGRDPRTITYGWQSVADVKASQSATRLDAYASSGVTVRP